MTVSISATSETGSTHLLPAAVQAGEPGKTSGGRKNGRATAQLDEGQAYSIINKSTSLDCDNS